jgi:hypothetical protein
MGDMGLTVTSVVATHPLAMVKVTMAVPPDTPVATPLVDTTEATAALLLVHVPDVPPSAKSVTVPWQMLVVPVTGPGGVRTFTVAEAMQPAPME